MKKILFLISLFTSLSCFSQAEKTDLFVVSNDTIQYTRLDYSQYGVSGIYISMYEETPSTKLILPNAVKYLKNISNLYHTLYFFISLPEKKFTKEQKEIIFAAFAKHIVSKENLPEAELFLNFDEDYSYNYQEEALAGKESNTRIKRIYTGIKATTIHKGL